MAPFPTPFLQAKGYAGYLLFALLDALVAGLRGLGLLRPRRPRAAPPRPASRRLPSEAVALAASLSSHKVRHAGPAGRESHPPMCSRPLALPPDPCNPPAARTP